jgi:putative inorganic carbon (HCO3(-)) transporter
MLSISQKSGKRGIFRKRGDGWLWALLMPIAVLVGYLLAVKMVLGIGVFAGFVGAAIILVCMFSPEAGLAINVIYSFFAFHISREFFRDSFPEGVTSNLLIIATFLGLFGKGRNIREHFSQYVQSPVVRIFLINVVYICIELFNPLAHSFEGWYTTARAVLMSALLLFLSYSVFDNYNSIRRFIIVLFIFSGIVGLYGCIQQWKGLADFELSWVSGDPVRYGLIFIGGDYRKFSTMGDPTGFAIVMSSCAAFFIVLLTGKWKTWKRLVLLAGIAVMVLGMAFSGTRTGNAMLLAGIFMFILLTIQKQGTKLFLLLGGLVFLAIMYGPFSGNATVFRFRSTFSGSKDESFNVRETNRKFIQPYIYRHPIGGGLGTTGAYGAAVNPGHELAGFPTDSGYLRKALEIGWLGLLLVVLLYYAVIRAGIRGYFQCTNERARLIYAGATACMFSFYVAEFAQDSIGQITDMVVYYPMIAIILQLKKYEKEINNTITPVT